MSILIKFEEIWGEKIAKEKRNIPLTEIADQTGISRATIYKYKNNTIKQLDRETLENLCRYFECEIGDLLTLSPPLKDSE